MCFEVEILNKDHLQCSFTDFSIRSLAAWYMQLDLILGFHGKPLHCLLQSCEPEGMALCLYEINIIIRERNVLQYDIS